MIEAIVHAAIAHIVAAYFLFACVMCLGACINLREK